MFSFEDPTIFLSFPIILFSLSVHECAHALVADMGGDDTARLQGRITLNPISHIDVIGTIIVPILLTLANMPMLGWARPVPVNINRLKKPYWDVLVTLAGPGSNLALALIAAIIMKVAAFVVPPEQWHYAALRFAEIFIGINVLLAIFNMLPIPPLDGSRVLFHYVISGRPKLYPAWDVMERFSFIFLYLIINITAVQVFLGWAMRGVIDPLRNFIGI